MASMDEPFSSGGAVSALCNVLSAIHSLFLFFVSCSFLLSHLIINPQQHCHLSVHCCLYLYFYFLLLPLFVSRFLKLLLLSFILTYFQHFKPFKLAYSLVISLPFHIFSSILVHFFIICLHTSFIHFLIDFPSALSTEITVGFFFFNF